MFTNAVGAALFASALEGSEGSEAESSTKPLGQELCEFSR
jgi:hypothetical protein